MAQPILLFGGTFDPVHNAHLAVARRALEALGAARLLWIPTGAPPYRERPVAAAADRLAMLRLALAGEPRHAIDERELAPGASGYTLDTVASLQEELPGHELVLLMGADQYAKRGSWHRWADLEKLVRVAVVARPGWTAAGGSATVVPMPPMEVSASDIRARLARGAEVAALLPAPVLAYVRERGLYR
ncbi:MAG TPA: nicotinate (nicotinamide) nucleotide adenylyltransferase [Burkholderiales bacterium]|nr:nicotinate (nicotinamide) nucleotide adenylyltransferase [Burkholderiales bacterium]